MTEAHIENVTTIDLKHRVGPGDDSFFVSLHAPGGTGWYGPVNRRVAAYVETVLAAEVIDLPTVDHRLLQERLTEALGHGGSREASWAVGAIDCAAWDLHGRLLDIPVANLLSNSPRGAVPAYGSWLRLDLDDPASGTKIADTAESGWLFTKWGLRREPNYNPDQEWSRLARAAARACGFAGAPVAVDAVGTWDAALTAAFADDVDPTSLVWLEDPLPNHDSEAYGRVDNAGLSMAWGERLLLGQDPAALFQPRRPAALTVDVVGCGGLTRALEIIDLARANQTPVFPHGRSLIPALHLAAAFPDVVPGVEYQLQWEPVRQRVRQTPLVANHGTVKLPDTAGLGAAPGGYSAAGPHPPGRHRSHPTRRRRSPTRSHPSPGRS